MEFLENFVSSQEAQRCDHIVFYILEVSYNDFLHQVNERMFDRLKQLPVRLVPERSCWVALPPAYVARLLDAQSPIPLVLQLRPVQGAQTQAAMHQPAFCGLAERLNYLCSVLQGDLYPQSEVFHVHMWVAGRASGPVCHVAWAGAAASSHALEIPAALARCLGLSDGALVALCAMPEVPLATSVSVEPADADDWEQVELNAEYMEEQLLNQVLRDSHYTCDCGMFRHWAPQFLQTVKQKARNPSDAQVWPVAWPAAFSNKACSYQRTAYG